MFTKNDIVIYTCLLINKTSFYLFVADKPHSGNHYAKKMPTDTKSGWHEFWICCECGHVFLEEQLQEHGMTRTHQKCSEQLIKIILLIMVARMFILMILLNFNLLNILAGLSL